MVGAPPYYAQGPKIELSGGALPILPRPATSMAFTDFHRQLSFFGMGVPKIRPTGDLSRCAKMTKIELGLADDQSQDRESARPRNPAHAARPRADEVIE